MKTPNASRSMNLCLFATLLGVWAGVGTAFGQQVPAATNLPPWVTIISPSNGTVLTGPASISIQAQAADPDGWVRNVNFFSGSTYLGGSGINSSYSTSVPTNTTSTYALTWSNVVSGHFVLSASVYDNLNTMRTSAPVTITVNLDPSVSVVQVAATVAYASEPGTNMGTFTISRYGNTNQELTVHYTVSGTAAAGADYAALPGSAVIPANVLSVAVPVAPIDVLVPKLTETVVLTLASDPSYFVGDPRSATVYVRDTVANNPPSVTLTAPADGASFKDPSAISLAATAADSDGTVSRVDFYVNGLLLATDTNSPFAVNWTSMQAGTYILTAKATDNLGAATTSQPVTVTVARTPMVRFNVTDGYASEPGGDTATIQVYRFNNTNDALTVSYTVGGTAVPDVDYTALSGSVTIPAGVATVPLVIQPIDNPLWYPSKSVALALASNGTYMVTDPRTATAYILSTISNSPPSVTLTAPADGAAFADPTAIALAATAADVDGSVVRVDFLANGLVVGSATNSPYAATWVNMMDGCYALTAKATDNRGAATTSQPVNVVVHRTPVVHVYATDAYASEPGGTDCATVQVYRYYNTNTDLVVNYMVGGTAVSGVDYIALPGSVTIPAGLSSVPVVIQPLNNATPKPTVTVVVTVTTNPAYLMGSPISASVSIRDLVTNNPPSVSLTAPADGTVYTDPTSILLAATASDVDGAVVRVDFLANGLVVGSATNSPYAATWASMMDGVYALTAKATDNLGAVTISPPVNVTVHRTPVVHVYATDAYASEPGVVDCATVQVYRYYNTNTDLVVNYAVGGTAVGGVDYIALPGSVTIPAGLSSVPVVIQPLNNTVAKPTLTVVVTVTNAPAYLVGDPRSATVYIKDMVTNNPPAVTLTSPADGTTYADPTNILLAATASDVDGTVVRVDYLANGLLIGSATNSPYTVSWQSMAPGVYVVTAKATDNLGAVSVSQPVTITVTRTTQVRVVALDAYASVAGDCATVQVYRYYNTNVDLVVKYMLGGTASNGVDYVALPGNVTIPAGRSSVNLTVQPIINTRPGPTETVIVTLSSNAATAAPSPCSAVVYILNNNTNQPPVVALTAPAQGAAFTAPTNIAVTASASDPDGAVARVDFFANNVAIGSVYGGPLGGTSGTPNGNTPPVTDGGRATNNGWTVQWCPTADGAYALTARAVDNLGACATSLPVNVTVARLPVVQIVATDAHASKQGTDTGLFTVYRSANTNQSLAVSYAIGGTATNGVDYITLSGVVTVPAGALSAAVPLVPIAGGLVSKSVVETVTLSLLPTAAYQVGSPTQATVYLYNEATPNVPPVVQLIAPTNGATLGLPVSTVLKANASDADGSVVRVDFLVNGNVVGSVTNAPYEVPWSTTTAGYYVLTARATDDRGAAVVSSPVRVVAMVIPKPVATRYLPLGYVPGVKMLVMITVSQPTAFGSFSVADQPPAGWTVADVGVGGRYDAAEGVVRFGPVTVSSGQILTYDVVPPVGTTGVVTFVGVVTTDGASVPVAGTSSLAPIPPHPADNNPADFVMTVDEAAAYCELWKNALAPTASPGATVQNADTSLSVSYVARAGYLCQGAGAYRVSTNYPTPVVPMLWVTNTAVGPTPLYATSGYGTALSDMPSNAVPGQAFTVTIAVTPASATGAYALEEHPPAGWAVTNVSDQGVFSAASACIRWGLFLDGQPATVSYDITPATNSATGGAFSGVVSFDGVNVPIGGVRKTVRSP